MTTYYNYLGQPMAVSADPGSNGVHASGAGQTLTAPTGPSALYAYDASGHSFNNDTFIGSNGDNTFYVNNVTDVVQVASGLSGIKTIVSWAGGYTLPANVQDLVFYGAYNWGAGNALDNLIIMGGDERSALDGGGGNDVLVGAVNAGSDFQFEVNANGVPGGHDVFYNFHPGLSTVRITGAGFTSFSQIQSAMQQVGSDVVLTIDSGDSITFRNTTIAAFQPHDFLMPLDRSQLGAMTFDDEFSSLSLWNGSNGNWQTNFGGDLTKLDAYAITSNTEKQLYTAPNFVGQDGWNLSAYNPFSIEGGGVLDITAGKFSYADSQHTWGQAYYSGMLNSRGVFMQKYGYFEMRAQLPTDLGSWPGFWMVQDPYKGGVEGDILEHLAMYPDVDFVRTNDAGTVTGHTTYIPSLSGFHTYGMLWGPTTTTFYIDDMAVLQTPTPASWDKPMYMILNMALGGWGGPIDESTLPAQMKVDWVHVYGLSSSPVQVEIGAPTYTAASGVNSVTLIGPGGQTVTANSAGGAIVSDNAGGNHLIGASGNDSITLGGGGDTATGGGGADSFVVSAIPAAAGTITDFGTADKLDLTGVLSSLNYTGSNPVADGYIRFTDDGSGNTQAWANPNTTGSSWSVVTILDGVHADRLTINAGVVTELNTGSLNVTSASIAVTLTAGQVVNTSQNNLITYEPASGGKFINDGSISVTGSDPSVRWSVAVAQSGGPDPAAVFENDGQLSLTAPQALAVGGSITVQNNGSLTVSGTSASAVNGDLVNNGSITVTGGSGEANGAFDQNVGGLVQTQAGSSISVSGSGSSLTGVGLAHGGAVLNAGAIQVSGPSSPPGGSAYAGIAVLGQGNQGHSPGAFPVAYNSGAITVDPPNGMGIEYVAAPVNGVTDPVAAGHYNVINTGTITAHYAVLYDPQGIAAHLYNSGTLNGEILLTPYADTVVNAGVINGDIYLGDGNDSLDSHAGTIHGTVHLGTGASTVTLAAEDDRVALGTGGGDVTGGGGADTFLINALPTAGSTITDFGSDDRLDLAGLLSSLNYAGSNAVADGYLKFAADSSGDAQVWANPNTSGSGWTVLATLDGVAASALQMQGDVVVDGPGGGAGGQGSTPPPTTVTGSSANGFTASFQGVYRQYTVGAGGATVTGGPESANDALSNIHRIQFVDGYVATSPTDTAGQVYRLYEATLARPPDQEGLTNWTNQLNAGASLAGVAAGFVGSTEFRNTYGALDNNGFVTLLYHNVLHREPDSGGLSTWVGMLNSGQDTRAQVVTGFSESQEDINDLATPVQQGLWIGNADAAEVARLYDTMFGRLPDLSGLANWTSSLESGASLQTVANGFVASPEFQNTYGALNNTDFVTLLYHNVLHRPPDTAGLTNWVGMLNGGESRAQVAVGFSESGEHIANTAAHIDYGIWLAS